MKNNLKDFVSHLNSRDKNKNNFFNYFCAWWMLVGSHCRGMRLELRLNTFIWVLSSAISRYNDILLSKSLISACYIFTIEIMKFKKKTFIASSMMQSWVLLIDTRTGFYPCISRGAIRRFWNHLLQFRARTIDANGCQVTPLSLSFSLSTLLEGWKNRLQFHILIIR